MGYEFEIRGRPGAAYRSKYAKAVDLVRAFVGNWGFGYCKKSLVGLESINYLLSPYSDTRWTSNGYISLVNL
jgi:hypothetical protein